MHHEFTYPPHFSQRAGPDSPHSMSGTGSSRSSRSANGCMTATMGMLRSSARRVVFGMFQVDTRMNFGDELPARVGSQRGRGPEKWKRALVNCNEICCRLGNVASRKRHICLICPFCAICFNAVHGRRNLAGLDVSTKAYRMSKGKNGREE